MDTDSVRDSVVDGAGDPGGQVEEITNATLDKKSASKDTRRKVESALVRLELDLACCSEKLVNMNLLIMHVSARETDFEAFGSVKENLSVESAVKALEFDTLSRICDSEVREMDKFLGNIQIEINKVSVEVSSHKHLGEGFTALEKKLHDAKDSMKQAKDQVSDLLKQSEKFQRALPSSVGVVSSNEEKKAASLEDVDFLNNPASIHMQTSEQQRHILRMLEKSLARELDLENKLAECNLTLDDLKRRYRSTKQLVLSMEEEAASVYAHFLEADNASTVLMGISKELTGQLQVCHLNINSAVQRETELNGRLQNCMKTVLRLEKEEEVLQELAEKNSLEALILKNSWKEHVKALESLRFTNDASLDGTSEEVKDMEQKLAALESRAEKAEAECLFLAKAKKELEDELDLLKHSGITKEEADSLELQLKDTDIQLQQALAAVDASEENQKMMNSVINDMEILIENLKLKVSKAETRANGAEDNLIILSNSNVVLDEELNFLRGKVQCLEASLQQAEETKFSTAKDIKFRAKMMADLVVQLAIERKRLHKQISFLMTENKALVNLLPKGIKSVPDAMNCQARENVNVKGVPISKYSPCSVDSVREKEKDISGTSKLQTSPADSIEDNCESDSSVLKSGLETVRLVDAGQLGIKYVLLAIFIAVISFLGLCFLRPENCSF